MSAPQLVGSWPRAMPIDLEDARPALRSTPCLTCLRHRQTLSRRVSRITHMATRLYASRHLEDPRGPTRLRTATVGFVSDLPPPPPDPDSLDQRHHDPGHGHHGPVPEQSRMDRAAPEPGSRNEVLEVLASVGLGCAAGSPVLFVLIWFGIPYEFSVTALFLGLGLSAASLMGFKRLGSRYRVRAVVGLSVAAFIFPFFLLFDYVLGSQDFSCSSSLFWSCR